MQVREGRFMRHSFGRKGQLLFIEGVLGFPHDAAQHLRQHEDANNTHRKRYEEARAKRDQIGFLACHDSPHTRLVKKNDTVDTQSRAKDHDMYLGLINA